MIDFAIVLAATILCGGFVYFGWCVLSGCREIREGMAGRAAEPNLDPAPALKDKLGLPPMPPSFIDGDERHMEYLAYEEIARNQGRFSEEDVAEADRYFESLRDD